MNTHAGYQVSYQDWKLTHGENNGGVPDYGAASRMSGANGPNLWMRDTTTRESKLPFNGGFVKPSDVSTTLGINLYAGGCGSVTASQKLPSIKPVSLGFGLDLSVTPSVYVAAGCNSDLSVWVAGGAKVSTKVGAKFDVWVFQVGAGVYATVGMDARLQAGKGGRWQQAAVYNPQLMPDYVKLTLTPSVEGGIYGSATLGIRVPGADFVLGIALDGQVYLIQIKAPLTFEVGMKFVNPAKTKYRYYTYNGLDVNVASAGGDLVLGVFFMKATIIQIPPIWSKNYPVFNNLFFPEGNVMDI